MRRPPRRELTLTTAAAIPLLARTVAGRSPPPNARARLVDSDEPDFAFGASEED
ncbi:MAG TPA: hypothetical protein VMS56_05575 [Thermoanaerobaculia bacterium]|nr:hypothetical protein [Thermoanaerobaculia bacterium]